MLGIIHSDTWVQVGVTMGIAIGTAFFIVGAWAFRTLFNKVDDLEKENRDLNNQTLDKVSEIHDQVGGVRDRVSHLEGAVGLPLGSFGDKTKRE